MKEQVTHRCHKHDCTVCHYYCSVSYRGESWDLYSCDSSEQGIPDYYSLVARYGSDGGDYISADMKSSYDEFHPVTILQGYVRREQDNS